VPSDGDAFELDEMIELLERGESKPPRVVDTVCLDTDCAPIVCGCRGEGRSRHCMRQRHAARVSRKTRALQNLLWMYGTACNSKHCDITEV